MKKPFKINKPDSRILYGIWALLAWTLLLPGGAYAQGGRAYATIKGVVVEKENPAIPVEFATVQLLPAGAVTTTDAKGAFTFERVSPGKAELIVQFLGMTPIDTSFTIQEGQIFQLQLFMEYSSFRLNEVQVVATENKAGSATASNISRQAMDHLQTSSLSDLKQLMPGEIIANPSLSSTNNLTIRTLPTSTANTNMNSLGTAIIVDGAPMSNNANMQTLSPTISGSGGVAAEGSDVRSISTDNIESVVVVRGIPSAEYGDLTSGAVIIRSKAGREPLNLRFKANPQTYQISGGKGFMLSEKAGNMNISADYAYNITKPTESYIFYQRATAKLLYSNFIKKRWSSNTSFDLAFGKDTRNENPDDQRQQIFSGAQDITLRLNTNGTISINKGWLNNISYVVSGSYADKHSFHKELLGNAFAAYTTSMTDKSIVSNKPGQRVYDINGNELTKISPQELNAYCTYLPESYTQRYDIYGKELGLFAKLTANFNKGFSGGNNRILVGADVKSDGNLGDGKVYDLATPPYRQGGNTSPRPRAYKDIPFITQVGVYVEENLSLNFSNRTFNLQAGARYDNVNGKDMITPRINASIDIIPKWLTLRGGYGVAAKAPSLLYLYPEDAYFEFVNFNTLNSSVIPEDERLMLTTTRIFNTENPDLKIATNEKMEIGFDMQFGNKMRLAVTGYNENMRNGYTLAKTLETYNLIEYQTYKEGVRNPGSIPSLAPDVLEKIFVSYATPTNTFCAHNRGVEFDMDFGRIHSIRTAFTLNGGYLRTSSWLDNNTFSERVPTNSISYNVGVYEKAKSKDERERFATTLRITHNIPRIGFVVTLSTQVTWLDKRHTKYYNDSTFVKYISCEDGMVHNWDPAMASDPAYQYMIPSYNSRRHIGESYQPTIMFNIQITKEIGDFLRASFYANNMFNSRPLYESKRTPGSFTRLNESVPLFFGFELAISIK